jgi:hypothetical protein
LNLAFTKTGQSEDERALMPRQGPAMIDNIPALAWSCLPEGTEFLNQPWLDCKGLSLDEALGRRCTSAIHPENLRKLMDTWLALVVLGEPGEQEPDEYS